MVGVAFQLDHAAVLDLGQHAAAPDAHLAHGGDVAIAVGVQLSVLAGGLRHQRRDELAQCNGADGRCRSILESHVVSRFSS